MDSELRIAFAGQPGAAGRHVSVDGMTAEGPNLSHWPGNRTPRRFKADLSTGICLSVARAGAERERLLAGVEAVVNDHYDTDGFLSMLALCRPGVALAREEVCLAAAATGDYQAFQTRRGLAVDRIVLGLLRSERSPLRGELGGLGEGAREGACYRWLIENAEEVLDRPEGLGVLWEEEAARMEEALRWAREGGLVRRDVAAARMAVLESSRDVARMVLNTCAGRFRVLHVQRGGDGTLYRYHDRTESWFEVVTFTPPRRRDLRPLAERLQEREERAGTTAGRWCADGPSEPVPELYHGLPAAQVYGEITRTLTASALAPEVVVAELAEWLGGD